MQNNRATDSYAQRDVKEKVIRLPPSPVIFGAALSVVDRQVSRLMKTG